MQQLTTPENQGKTGGGHPLTKRGGRTVMNRERGELGERLGLLLQPGFASPAISYWVRLARPWEGA